LLIVVSCYQYIGGAKFVAGLAVVLARAVLWVGVVGCWRWLCWHDIKSRGLLAGGVVLGWLCGFVCFFLVVFI